MMDRPTSPSAEAFAANGFLDRRRFLFGPTGLGALALMSLQGSSQAAEPGPLELPHFQPKAKNVIFLTMAGGPSQLDLFDPKPELNRRSGEEISPAAIGGESFAQITGRFELLGSPYKFDRHGQSGLVFSELMPRLASVADELTMIRSMTTDSFNHDPAQILLNCGSPQPGRPSLGSWLSYGLGSENANLPAFVVMLSGQGQPLGSHCWSSGFLPSMHQGVRWGSVGSPVQYLDNPAWMDRGTRKRSVEAIRRLNEQELQRSLNPEIATRIAAYEMAFHMQTSVPQLVDFSDESQEVLNLYGIESDKRTFASNCLLARRLVERGVRLVQLYHRGWDHHGIPDTGGIDDKLPQTCREVDQASSALIQDLKRLGLLDDTLVIWGGEFGRTPIRQMANNSNSLGRDHHRRAFTTLLAGGGIRRGHVHGQTDELGFHVAEDPVHIHDLHATLLHCLGINHEQFTFRFQGRDFRLTDVRGRVVKEILA